VELRSRGWSELRRAGQRQWCATLTRQRLGAAGADDASNGPAEASADLVVRTTTPTLARVFSGAERWSTAVGAGSIEVAGPPALARKLPSWFLWSPWVDDVRAQARARERQ
jgi:hypothetical protein